VYTNTERGINGRLGRIFFSPFSPRPFYVVTGPVVWRSRLVRRVETTRVWYSVVRRRQRVAFLLEFAHNNSHLTGGMLARKRNETYGRSNIIKSFSISKTVLFFILLLNLLLISDNHNHHGVKKSVIIERSICALKCITALQTVQKKICIYRVFDDDRLMSKT